MINIQIQIQGEIVPLFIKMYILLEFIAIPCEIYGGRVEKSFFP